MNLVVVKGQLSLWIVGKCFCCQLFQKQDDLMDHNVIAVVLISIPHFVLKKKLVPMSNQRFILAAQNETSKRSTSPVYE